MKVPQIVGIILIVLGVIALAYQGFSWRTREQRRVVDLGPLKVDANVEEQHHLPLPPILGVCAMAGGVVLLVTSSRRSGA
jgi:drug/metabolite transporter (DMT)-like permease